MPDYYHDSSALLFYRTVQLRELYVLARNSPLVQPHYTDLLTNFLRQLLNELQLSAEKRTINSYDGCLILIISQGPIYYGCFARLGQSIYHIDLPNHFIVDLFVGFGDGHHPALLFVDFIIGLDEANQWALLLFVWSMLGA